MISEKIKLILYEKNISIKEFAEIIDMSEAGLHRAFKNDDFKISTLQKIAEKLNIEVGYFFGKSEIEEENISLKKFSKEMYNVMIDLFLTFNEKRYNEIPDERISQITSEVNRINDFYKKNFKE